MQDKQELLSFADDDAEGSPLKPGRPSQSVQQWRILVVDDDPDVHGATKFVLDGSRVLNRPLAILHAYSATEAEAVLRQESNIAVILLDVVMESDDAGLQLVHTIRQKLGNSQTRIILRTGQPGQAPEMSAIRDYDINDYKTKSELTHARLHTSLIAAIRSYDQICRLESARQGLELIVKASSELMEEQGLRSFATGVITQLAALIGVESNGLVCARERPGTLGDEAEEYVVIGAAGEFAPYIQQALDRIPDQRVSENIRECLSHRESHVGEDFITLYLQTRDEAPLAAFINTAEMPRQPEQDLLGVFSNNVSLCAQNIRLIDRLHEVAFMDVLVRLPNRISFVEAINDCIELGGKNTHCIAIIDVDQFAEMNNAFGHAHGDAMLVALSHRLVEYFDERTLVCKLSGDSFGVLGLNEAIAPARVRPAFGKPLMIDGVEYSINASVAYVRLSDTSGDGNAALKDASITLKMAKHSGINSDAWFSKDIQTEALERTRLLHQLKSAFDDQHLFPVFQPQVDLRTGKAIGFEVLMRWRGQDGRMISPDRFIPLAENSGMIVALGNWILRAALRTLGKLHEAGFTGLRIAVNVSVVQFRAPNFLQSVEEALASSGVVPTSLELEITESVAMMETNSVHDQLERLRALGIAIAIDDFGTGYSSLSYLEKLPADRLKIDRSFVDTLEKGRDGGRIAALVIQLARQIGMKTIAEGIEEGWQRSALLELGCEEGQGYHFGRPMPAAELPDWLDANAKESAIS